ncbi:MAG: zinc-ribbon domain-containing protein [Gammaproteobacteria bacterium]|nr:zinc-ribbon domain-containing protein [Gammaproteobacteria bacterium]
MFATCPRCATVFRVNAAQLRRGHGEVRCGHCREVFDAVATLTDEMPGSAPPSATHGLLGAEATSEATSEATTGAISEAIQQAEQLTDAAPAPSPSAREGQAEPTGYPASDLFRVLDPCDSMAGGDRTSDRIEQTDTTPSEESTVATPVADQASSASSAALEAVTEPVRDRFVIIDPPTDSATRNRATDIPATDTQAEVPQARHGLVEFVSSADPESDDPQAGPRTGPDVPAPPVGSGVPIRQTSTGAPAAQQTAADNAGSPVPLPEACDSTVAAPGLPPDAAEGTVVSVAAGASSRQHLAADRPASTPGDTRNDASPPAVGSESAPMHRRIPTGLGAASSIAALEAPFLQPRSASPWRSIGWVTLALTLLVGLGLQYVWFHPLSTISRYPQSVPLVQDLCRFTGCRLPDRRAPDRIAILSRDVRIHPRHDGVLMVTLAVRNEADFAQAWPWLRLTLFDVRGQALATRTFAPSEYLSREVSADEKLDRGASAQITLQLLAPEEPAVSFEFLFL